MPVADVLPEDGDVVVPVGPRVLVVEAEGVPAAVNPQSRWIAA